MAGPATGARLARRLILGLLLNALQDLLKNYLGFLGSLIGGLLEFSWAVVTYFVVPVLVTERVGPITAAITPPTSTKEIAFGLN